MDRFVRRENIKRYRKLLREANEEAERRLIQKLLIEEAKGGGNSDALAFERAPTPCFLPLIRRCYSSSFFGWICCCCCIVGCDWAFMRTGSIC
jgi:hypothetical protein